MCLFKFLLAKLKGIDPYYKDMRPEQLDLYQHYFMKIISAVDVSNNTKWSRSKPYDRARLSVDDDRMERIVVSEAVQEGLSAVYLQVMVNQYFFADERARELDRENWVKRVIHRKGADYFPDGFSTRLLLEKINR